MTDTTKHSPLPWILNLTDSVGFYAIEDANTNFVLHKEDAGDCGLDLPSIEDAAHIVKCVNEAPELHKRIADLENEIAALNEINEGQA